MAAPTAAAAFEELATTETKCARKHRTHDNRPIMYDVGNSNT